MTIKRETHYRLDSRLGDIELTVQGEVVTALRFSDLAGSGDSAALPAAPARFREVLKAWFEGRGSGLEIVSPELAGTLFQQQVWRALRDIARGQRVSYRQLASSLGRPHAARAVASAVAANPVLLLLPCHRVIGSDGSLRGYAGGLELKARLLAMEQALPPAPVEQPRLF